MSHQLEWISPTGQKFQPLLNWSRLEYMRSDQKSTGFLKLAIDPILLGNRPLMEGVRLEPWRTVGDSSPFLDGEAAFILRSWEYKQDRTGARLLHIEADDSLAVLDGPTIAYASESAQADKAAELDDMMKAYVRENLGALATDTTRDITTVMTVQADLTLAPSSTKAAARKNLLSVLRDLSNDSLNKGTFLTFDVVRTGNITSEFRTYINQRGVDHGQTSAQPIEFSERRFNLTEITSGVIPAKYNYIYAGGQGAAGAKVIKTAGTVTGINRRELWIDARNKDDESLEQVEAAIQAEADAALYANREKKFVNGKIVEKSNCRYGVHFKYGDKVFVYDSGIGLDAHIDALHVTVEGGKTTDEIWARGEA